VRLRERDKNISEPEQPGAGEGPDRSRREQKESRGEQRESGSGVKEMPQAVADEQGGERLLSRISCGSFTSGFIYIYI
jgi:hypothetical protein